MSLTRDGTSARKVETVEEHNDGDHAGFVRPFGTARASQIFKETRICISPFQTKPVQLRIPQIQNLLNLLIKIKKIYTTLHFYNLPLYIKKSSQCKSPLVLLVLHTTTSENAHTRQTT